MGDPVRGVYPLTLGPPFHAGPYLRLFPVVCLDPGDDPILHMHPQQAASAAVLVAASVDYLFLPSQSLIVDNHDLPPLEHSYIAMTINRFR
jgi:hypothetical protein